MKPNKKHPFRVAVKDKPKDDSVKLPKKNDNRDLAALHKMEEMQEKKQLEDDLF